jgi:hypothetical protein
MNFTDGKVELVLEPGPSSCNLIKPRLSYPSPDCSMASWNNSIFIAKELKRSFMSCLAEGDIKVNDPVKKIVFEVRIVLRNASSGDMSSPLGRFEWIGRLIRENRFVNLVLCKFIDAVFQPEVALNTIRAVCVKERVSISPFNMTGFAKPVFIVTVGSKLGTVLVYIGRLELGVESALMRCAIVEISNSLPIPPNLVPVDLEDALDGQRRLFPQSVDIGDCL